MDSQERRYKIKMRREYKKELSTLKKGEMLSALTVGVTSLTLIVIGNMVGSGSLSPIYIYSNLSIILSSVCSLIKTVRVRERLETELEHLESNLSDSQENTDRNQEERVGRSRW